MDLEKIFKKFDDEYIKFERIVNPPSKCPDLCAFLLLEKLLPGNSDIVSSAGHDEIWLNIDCNKLAEIATEEDILYLTRCGVRFESENDSLAMFV